MELKKIIFSLIIFYMGALPSFALIDAKITKGYFYDPDSTIMNEITPQKTLSTEEYWTKNVLHFNKYRPLFMLSNKELFDLMPQDRVSVSQRISTPSIYNISLKSTSINKISLNPYPAQQHIMNKKITTEQPVNQNAKLITQYEQVKSKDTDLDKKIDVAILLKDSKKLSNYALAFDLLDEVTAKEPYNAYAFYLKGELYSQKKDSENAIKNYAEALRINPMSKQCCLGLAKALEPTNKLLAQKYYQLAKSE